MKTKVLPIGSCKNCPRLNEEDPYYECELSDVRCYEKEDDGWVEYLEQFCPLEYLDDIMDKAFEEGKNYSHMKDEMNNQVKQSTEQRHWFSPQEFLSYVDSMKE